MAAILSVQPAQILSKSFMKTSIYRFINFNSVSTRLGLVRIFS